MPKTTATDKAARALLERRVRVVKATDSGVVISATSSMWMTAYTASAVRTYTGPVRECSCPHGRVHGPRARCWHTEAAELLLGRDVCSDR